MWNAYDEGTMKIQLGYDWHMIKHDYDQKTMPSKYEYIFYINQKHTNEES